MQHTTQRQCLRPTPTRYETFFLFVPVCIVDILSQVWVLKIVISAACEQFTLAKYNVSVLMLLGLDSIGCMPCGMLALSLHSVALVSMLLRLR